MAYVPAGEFLMGSAPDDPLVRPWFKPLEQPQHPVVVDAFFIDRREVTNAEFARFRPDHVRHPRSACDDCPVTAVSWVEARDYCAAARPPKRLPTEAEWEKAAKGGADTTPEPLEAYAWYAKNAPRIALAGDTVSTASPVGTRRPNGYGLHDMLGNAREWTADWYAGDYYWNRLRDNPPGPAEGTYRSERGGSFLSHAAGVRASIRYNQPPGARLFYLGFRCAQDP
ncbi:MAG TPA: SUMF1/EgtB/PvdO family nonheme iron enzyme [Candidatus Binatia bacterium]|nr:SUMF1/EgtB/PvdO family nonheme iron enzyme [Candidatus Binatia bacterium]